MRLGYFTMPVHPLGRDWSQTLREDREAIILADKLGFYDAFVGEHLTDACENITNSMMFQATLIHDTKTDQACDRHHQSCADASGGDCGERRDVRPSVAGPLRDGCERGRADLRFRGDRNPRPRPQQDFRGGDRRHPRGLGAQPALRHRLSGQPLQGHLRAHRGARARRRDTCQTISEATARNRRHGGRAVFSGRRPHGETRLSSFIGELPSAETPQVALVKLCQGQGGGWREGQYRRLARGANDLRRRR